jgi:hypothetical protein
MKALCVALTAVCLAPVAARAELPGTINIQVENDSFINGIDRHYTSGLYGSWTSAPEERGDIESFAENLMPPGDGGQWRHGFFAGQTMYTPENLFAAIPSASDQPYAGFLFAGARVYRDDGDTLDRIEATVGMVGPASLAGNVQKWWHAMGLFGGIKPRGWHYQLRDEPGLILTEQRIWRIGLTDGGLESEILPEVNGSVGNVFTYAGAGATFRIGSGLTSDWGPPRIAPAQAGADFQAPDSVGWYLYAGMEGRAVARDIFLDGNSFHDSARVGNETPVGDFSAGAALLAPGIRLQASYTARSREFPGQRGRDQTVAINLGFAD